MSIMRHSLLGISVLLVIIWAVARIVLAVTSFTLHILLFLAAALAVLWLIRLAKKT